MRRLPWLKAAALAFAVPGGLAVQVPIVAPVPSEDARLYAFLDKEFAESFVTGRNSPRSLA